MNIVNFNKIKELAESKKMSLERLANTAGFGKSTMYNYINGTSQININELYTISRILDVNIGDLLTVPTKIEEMQAGEPFKKYGEACIECIKKEGVIDHLKDTLREKDEKISELEQICKKYKPE